MPIDGGHIDLPSMGSRLWRRDSDGLWGWRVDLSTRAGHRNWHGKETTSVDAMRAIIETIEAIDLDEHAPATV